MCPSMFLLQPICDTLGTLTREADTLATRVGFQHQSWRGFALWNQAKTTHKGLQVSLTRARDHFLFSLPENYGSAHRDSVPTLQLLTLATVPLGTGSHGFRPKASGLCSGAELWCLGRVCMCFCFVFLSLDSEGLTVVSGIEKACWMSAYWMSVCWLALHFSVFLSLFAKLRQKRAS